MAHYFNFCFAISTKTLIDEAKLFNKMFKNKLCINFYMQYSVKYNLIHKIKTTKIFSKQKYSLKWENAQKGKLFFLYIHKDYI